MIRFPDVVSLAQTNPDFARDVIEGLSESAKRNPSRWLYDETGAMLFEEITALEEYYPTRTEIGILEQFSDEISEFIGGEAILVEYGSGSSRKTRILLDALRNPSAYVPVDISEEMLQTAAAHISRRYAGIDVVPVAADFMRPFDLPEGLSDKHRRVAFFPGSTIGNLDGSESIRFLRRVAGHVGAGGRAVIGFDLRKDVRILIAAYDDAWGVTAAFNRNILGRINRELAGDFDPLTFAHEARWNEEMSRIEMHLVSQRRQKAHVLSRTFDFTKGETIHTENSYKYSVEQFSGLAERSGWTLERIWTDPNGLFALGGLAQRTAV